MNFYFAVVKATEDILYVHMPDVPSRAGLPSFSLSRITSQFGRLVSPSLPTSLPHIVNNKAIRLRV